MLKGDVNLPSNQPAYDRHDWGCKTLKFLCDLTIPLSGMVCHSWASTFYDLPNLKSFSPPTMKI